jgi:outer membrane lipoprotein-sorting protein
MTTGKIRFRVMLVLAALATIMGTVKAQDETVELEQILSNHYKSTGLENKRKINTLITVGKLNQLGSDLNITIIQKRPTFYRMDVHLEDGRITQAYNGEEGWMINPYLSADTVAITGPELVQLAESADFDGILVNYEELGYKIEYESAGVLGARPVYILKLTRDPSSIIRVFLDANNYLIVKTEAEYSIEGFPLQALSEFSDYRKRAGVMFPYRIENRNGQLTTEIRIDTIRINERLDDILFR